MSTNQDALNNIYSEVQSKGYKKSLDEFSELIGIKKDVPNSSVQSIDVVSIISTQKNVNINNIKEVKDVRERPLLFKQGDKYYVIDGNHRISNEILAGEKKVEMAVI